MRTAPALLLALLLALPVAGAWPATFVSAPSAASLRESLLVAGAIDARSEGGVFGAPAADRLTFDAPVSVRMCPDQAGEMQPAQSCAGAQDTTAARLYVHAGGVVAQPAANAEARLHADASAAALGGPNVTLNKILVGPAVFAGGASVVTVSTSALALRPLQSTASLEVRGDEGYRTYNGTGYTLYLGNLTEARLEARGAFLGGAAPDIAVAPAGIERAEAGIRVKELYELLRLVQPPERADRRADLAGAFGPFQLVPALLDGAAAARANLTLNGEPRAAFTFVRVHDLRLGNDGANWTGTGNATYLVDDETLVPEPGDDTRPPILFPLLLAVAALAARLLTKRAQPPAAHRRIALALRALGLVALAFLAAAALDPLLGLSPLLDAPRLALRSRAQLALLTAGMVALAWSAVGLSFASLTKSAFAWRRRADATLVPVAVGLVATGLVLLLAAPQLLSVVARFVRL